MGRCLDQRAGPVVINTIADVIDVCSPWDKRVLGCSVPAGGNTREGPLYAAQEMTEQRLVVLSG